MEEGVQLGRGALEVISSRAESFTRHTKNDIKNYSTPIEPDSVDVFTTNWYLGTLRMSHHP